jgi:hypothetical protein
LSATRNRYPTEIGDPVDLVPPLPELQEGVLRQLGRIGPVPGDEVQRLEHPRCSSAKNAAKSLGASGVGNLMTSPSACITLLDAAETLSA